MASWAITLGWFLMENEKMIIKISDKETWEISPNLEKPEYEKGTLGYDIEEAENTTLSSRRRRIAGSDNFHKTIFWFSKVFLVEKKLSIAKRLVPKAIQPYAELLVLWEFLERKPVRKGNQWFVEYYPTRDGEHIFLKDYCDFLLKMIPLMKYGLDD
jgi:hypothetical protein